MIAVQNAMKQWGLLCRLLTWPHGLFSNYTIYKRLRTITVPLYILIIQVPAGFTWMPVLLLNLTPFSLHEQFLNHFNCFNQMTNTFPGPPEGLCTCECPELMRGRTPRTDWGSSTRPSARSWAWCTTTPSIGGSLGQPHPSLSGHSILMTWTSCDVWQAFSDVISRILSWSIITHCLL